MLIANCVCGSTLKALSSALGSTSGSAAGGRPARTWAAGVRLPEAESNAACRLTLISEITTASASSEKVVTGTPTTGPSASPLAASVRLTRNTAQLAPTGALVEG